MLTKTPYDYLAENRDDLIRAENGIEVKYDYYKDKNGIERHLIINHEAERMIFEKSKLTKIQEELTEYALQKYKEREQKKIDTKLDDYITINKNENQLQFTLHTMKLPLNHFHYDRFDTPNDEQFGYYSLNYQTNPQGEIDRFVVSCIQEYVNLK
jgi:hypothetical protein